MSERMLPLDPATAAGAVGADLDFSDEVKPLLVEDASAESFFRSLVDASLVPDAILFLARALPKSEAVAWASQCVRTGADRVDEGVLALAEGWAAEPTEENRQAALHAAEADEYASPSAMVAAAAGWSGGTMVPDGSVNVPPAEHLTAQAVSAALQMSAIAVPERYDARLADFLAGGLERAQACEPSKAFLPDQEQETPEPVVPAAAPVPIPPPPRAAPRAPEAPPAPRPPRRPPAGGDWDPKPL